MKKHRRFSHSHEQKPLLFFAGAFVLGTFLLLLVFVVFNKEKKPIAENTSPLATAEEKAEDEGTLMPIRAEMTAPPRTAPSEEAYRAALLAASTVFFDGVRTTLGGWIDAPDFETRIQNKDVVEKITAQAEKFRAALLEMIVPSSGRTRHLALAATLDDLLQLLRKDSAVRIDAPLLRIQEIMKAITTP